MKIALMGYGKMGKAIEKVALERGHNIIARIDLNNPEDKLKLNSTDIDVVIEFSSPLAAVQNLSFCMQNKLKVVCGTTGWIENKKEIDQLCIENDTAFFYASNYSIGVNLFFKINEFVAKIMNNNSQYEISTTEIHHTEKLDAPSGTAITLAEGIINNNAHKNSYVNNQIANPQEVPIWSSREGKVPGTHSIKYISEIDEIEIKHTAYTRLGFALGAVLAAEWLVDKKGVLGMDDMIKI